MLQNMKNIHHWSFLISFVDFFILFVLKHFQVLKHAIQSGFFDKSIQMFPDKMWTTNYIQDNPET